jgi:hypothetical protein
MKIKLLVGIIILITIISFLLYSQSTQEINTGSGVGSEYPIESIVPDRQADSFNLRTTNGSIEVKNFIFDERTYEDPINEGYYQLGYFVDPRIDKAPESKYIIEFMSQTQYFAVVLLQEPIAAARIEAEMFLMDHLDITQAELCTIDYMVTVPSSVNLIHAGVDLRFSFCPGTVELP